MEIPPQCPKDYKLKKSKCKCVPDITQKPESTIVKSRKSPGSFSWHPLRKCPKGSTRNKKTKKCEWRHGAKRVKQTIKKRKPAKNPTKHATRKPTKRVTKKKTENQKKNDARLNKLIEDLPIIKLKTPPKQNSKEIRAIQNKLATRKLSPIKSVSLSPVIRATPKDQEQLGDHIMNMYKKKGETKITNKAIMKSLATKSFSPSINKQLTKIKDGEIHGALGCMGSSNNTIAFNKGIAEFKKDPMVNVSKDPLKPLCYLYKRKESQNLMLKNLNTKIDFNCGNIITPKQIKTNCWFNTLFVTLFISDKGRKFFRYFRTLMIKGIKSDGVKIAPPSLQKSFFVLNMLIEASFNLNNTSKNIAMLMDTNELIQSIGNAIRLGWSKQGIKTKNQPKIPKPGQWANPLQYYKNMMSYLDENKVELITFDIYTNKKNIDFHTQNLIDNFKRYTRKQSTIPEIIVGEIYDKDQITKILSFEVQDPKGEKIKYALDSIIIRDDSKSHFCSLITCNKEEYGFDGASFRHLEKIKWKNMINKNKKWNFRKENHLKWNFMQGYMMLFYYRVK